MPEGPEILLFSEYLKQYIMNNYLTNIISISKTKINILKKAKILDIGAKGKLLWLRTKHYYIHILLKISGWISKENLKNPKYILLFDDNKKVYIDDPRKLCLIKIVENTEHENILNILGIDIFTRQFTINIFEKLLYELNMNICAFLMNQNIVCGVGNYIKNESLYLAKIHPKRKCNTLTNIEIKNLFNSIRFVCYSNLFEQLNEYRIKINKKFISDKPSFLEVPYKFKVYKQDRDPNGYKVISEIIAGRNTYYISEIQF